MVYFIVYVHYVQFLVTRLWSYQVKGAGDTGGGTGDYTTWTTVNWSQGIIQRTWGIREDELIAPADHLVSHTQGNIGGHGKHRRT